MMSPEARVKKLEECGAILKGHFQYASGRHGDTYVEKFRILQAPKLTTILLSHVLGQFRGQVTMVAGPTTGGGILSFEAARLLGVTSLIAERKENSPGREFKRGFEIGPGDEVLVIDDVLTTGGSIAEVITAVNERGAEVRGVVVLVDRTAGKTDFKVPFAAVIELDIQSWVSEDCPLCAQGLPLTVT